MRTSGRNGGSLTVFATSRPACPCCRHARTLVVALLLFLLHFCCFVKAIEKGPSPRLASNTWAVVVSSSRYLFNYRHTANALTMYHLLRTHGVDDEHILLFLPDSFACDPRNPHPAAIYVSTTTGEQPNLYGCSAQVDYAGNDVDVRRFLAVLQGRYDENTPPTRRLLSDEQSNIVIYIAGHGARSFFKFQDSEFLSSSDLSETLSMMHQQRRYGKVVVLADTCYAIALCEYIRAPNVTCLASSSADMESYAYANDRDIGVSAMSKWMAEALQLLSGTSCSDRAATTLPMLDGRDGLSILHRSWWDFTYGPERSRNSSFASAPAHRDAVNDPSALKEWTVADFLCPEPLSVTPVDVRYDLL